MSELSYSFATWSLRMPGHVTVEIHVKGSSDIKDVRTPADIQLAASVVKDIGNACKRIIQAHSTTRTSKG